MVATAALTSLGTTSPLYMRQHAMYFPCLGSHLAIMEAGSNAELVISAVHNLVITQNQFLHIRHRILEGGDVHNLVIIQIQFLHIWHRIMEGGDVHNLVI